MKEDVNAGDDYLVECSNVLCGRGVPILLSWVLLQCANTPRLVLSTYSATLPTDVSLVLTCSHEENQCIPSILHVRGVLLANNKSASCPLR